MDAAALAEYNPALEGVPPLARIAYAKFKANLIEGDESIRRGVSVEEELITSGECLRTKVFSTVHNGRRNAIDELRLLSFAHFMASSLWKKKGSILS